MAGDLYGGSARADPARIAAAMHDGTPGRPVARLPVPARRRGGLDQRAVPAAGCASRRSILSGDDDPLIPLVNARLMHRLIPDSRLHVYHGGHLGLVTEAAELAPVVDGFLAAPLR